ncbi:glutathione peroxidase [Nocardioides sp. Iso805N]|uniref:glutathione peroxidase n=1 Tax=Nocardioides sp. Iso805N TaxID=1283287 RepID=UPI000360B884|nr:glutathione peroxidase [Nocardioides sp. Iso805N]
MATLSDFRATRLDGSEEPLSDYAGKVVLVVNTASKCGFTPQLEGLESLWQTYGERGLVVLGFPCNQFGNQEPGTADEIGDFCQRNYGVSFPMFAKVDVNGDHADPLYRWLRSQARGVLGSKVRWNFTKFLLDPDGVVVRRFGSATKPDKIAPAIEALLPVA